MPEIRYICVSDLHLGAANSLLTRLASEPTATTPSKPDPLKANDVMISLVGCLKALTSQNTGPKKPTLILNGDILELALADLNVAAMVFERFMELTMKPGEELFDRTIYYNPGNHDHHLWETARETQYVDKYLAGTAWGSDLEAPWHTTNMFLGEYDPVPCYLLDSLMDRFKPAYPAGQEPEFLVVYPNFGVRSADRKKCVIFSHGHYIESIYRLMTSLRTALFPGRNEPDLIWDLESENFAWVDFFWSTLGRSGAFGTDVELIYDKLQSDAALKAMMSNMAAAIASKYGLPWVPHTVEHMVLTSLLDFLAGTIAKREVKQTGGVLSQDADAGLHQFIESYLLNQIRTDNDNLIPGDVTFVFGHTHKPFEQVRQFAGYGAGVKVFNDGGWVVDSLNPTQIQGAAIVLVDDDLNTASVRLYNQAANDSQKPPLPYVSEVIDNPLVQRLKSTLAGGPAWSALNQAVFAEVPLQRANLAAKIQEQC
jgi:hypothetical protein